MSTTTNAQMDVGMRLIPSRSSKRWGGFGNLLRKELGQWWSTKLWWIQTLIWVLLLDGVTLIAALDQGGMSTDERFFEATRTPFLMASVVVGIGIVVTIQSTIIGEKDQGTAAWVMSKPVSRASFVMSKIVAHSIGFLTTALVIPAIVYAVISTIQFPGMLDYANYAVALSITALSILFYVALTTCLGTLFGGRGAVAGIGIAFILTGQFFNGMLPAWLVLRTPWLLGEVAASFSVATPPDWSRTTPIVFTAVATVALCLLAVWRFGRDEF